jgi:hypothetical protein
VPEAARKRLCVHLWGEQIRRMRRFSRDARIFVDATKSNDFQIPAGR